jgi:uncharacterized protein (TIGR04255 family)
MAQRYKRPPITEAVVEIRVENQISREVIDGLQKKLLAEYPAPPEQGVLWNFEVGEAATKFEQQFQAHKLSSHDGTDVVTIGLNVIATSRLAPYEGWEPFIARARDNWDVWKRAVGYQKIVRIGVRYVNRIDIPNPTDVGISVGSYLKFFPVLPTFFSARQLSMDNFAINCSVPLGVEGCNLVLNASSAPSPLVKTTSFILDLDVSRMADLPQKEEDVWSLIDRIRDLKNQVFENCVTDQARQLFSS